MLPVNVFEQKLNGYGNDVDVNVVWDEVVWPSGFYQNEATQTLCCSDSSDFIAKIDDSYWLFSHDEQSGQYDAEYLGKELSFTWSDEHVGQEELSHSERADLQLELENVMSGITVKYDPSAERTTSKELDEWFGNEFSRLLEEAIEEAF